MHTLYEVATWINPTVVQFLMCAWVFLHVAIASYLG